MRFALLLFRNVLLLDHLLELLIGLFVLAGKQCFLFGQSLLKRSDLCGRICQFIETNVQVQLLLFQLRSLFAVQGHDMMNEIDIVPR